MLALSPSMITRSKYSFMLALSPSMIMRSKGCALAASSLRESAAGPTRVEILDPAWLRLRNFCPNSTKNGSSSKETTSPFFGIASARARAAAPQKLPTSKTRHALFIVAKHCSTEQRSGPADQEAWAWNLVFPSAKLRAQSSCATASWSCSSGRCVEASAGDHFEAATGAAPVEGCSPACARCALGKDAEGLAPRVSGFFSP